MAIQRHEMGDSEWKRNREYIPRRKPAERLKIIDTPIPHFATVSYAFAARFPSELFAEIFAWILDAAVERRLVDAKTVFLDATHIKANANRKKYRKVLAQNAARVCCHESLKTGLVDLKHLLFLALYPTSTTEPPFSLPKTGVL